jgi:hypothetical protein
VGAMSSQNPQQNLYQQKINALINDVNSLRMQLSGTEEKINRVDNVLSKLPSRITSVRNQNYRIQTNFEPDQQTATQRWTEIGPTVKSKVSSQSSTLKMELNLLERDINSRRISASHDLLGLSGFDLRINTIRVLISDFTSRVGKEMMTVDSILNPLEEGVLHAEAVVKLTSAASFQWKEGESPVVALHAKDMNQKTDGILTLTNQRIIFEVEKEIVLKKTLFIVTEKKIERTLMLERPIGSISKLTKGRVGLLAGAGLFIEFKQGEPELKLDTKNEEADTVQKYYGMITSGQIDEELEKLAPKERASPEKRVVSCPKCGAPYSDEIYRGQQTVQCKYCSTTISLQ